MGILYFHGAFRVVGDLGGKRVTPAAVAGGGGLDGGGELDPVEGKAVDGEVFVVEIDFFLNAHRGPCG